MANSEKNNMSEVDEETKFISKEINRRKIFISSLKRRILRHVWPVRIAIVSIIILVLYLTLLLAGNLIKRSPVSYYFELAENFIFTPKDVIREINGRTNILILGKGGGGHEAPDLTDTMLFLSLDLRQKKVTLISLPRDIWLPALRTKLNSVYYWGNKKEDSGGLVLAKASVEEILGQNIHYAVILDFSGFKKIIDVLGGIEVDVEASFSDEKYPIPGRENDLCEGDPEYKCRYETIHFVQGRQFMDGETALKFVRSRNAEGDEGTDFARQKRQQKIIKAIEEGVLNKKVLLSPQKLSRLKEALFSGLETDIKDAEAAVIARGFIDSKNDISTFILPEDLLINPPKSVKYDNLYVFVPKNEDWGEIHSWVGCVLEGGSCI